MERISSSSIGPEEFFEQYIKKRTPVSFTEENVSKSINPVRTLWSNSYLLSKCGTQHVRVEYKKNCPTSKFGEGMEKMMLFSDFLHEIENGNENLYLTTQELEYDNDGRPSLTSPPATQILSDISFTPSLFKTLIVANINIWFGATSRYITSGLHHDYHDNLYVLLRGTKKITLYSPKDAEKLYTIGRISHVHPNGRINYTNRSTRADGSDIHAEAALQASARLDILTKKMEEPTMPLPQKNSDENEDDTEEQIESALQDLLDAEAAAADLEDKSELDEDSDAAGENDSSSDAGEPRDDTHTRDDIDEEEEDENDDGVAIAAITSRKRHHQPDSSNSTAGKKGRVNQTSERPLNFSRVDTSLPPEQIKQSFPLFAECQGMEITLAAGEMLYIPCGWFHEVRSLGPPGDGGHLALNYWFHPPDGDSFHRPYTSDFWRADMKARGLES